MSVTACVMIEKGYRKKRGNLRKGLFTDSGGQPLLTSKRAMKKMR